MYFNKYFQTKIIFFAFIILKSYIFNKKKERYFCFYAAILLIMKKIVIFASGSGTNAQNIIEYFNKRVENKVCLVLSNRKEAKVLDRASKLGIPSLSFNRQEFYETGRVMGILKEVGPDLIVLAGFLWLVPANILRKYPGKVINIHPALLPRHGGKGMYGAHVHEAVLANQEKESGITIHFLNEEYDKGDIIFQKKCSVFPNDTAEKLAARIHQLEYKHFPVVIDQLLKSM